MFNVPTCCAHTFTHPQVAWVNHIALLLATIDWTEVVTMSLLVTLIWGWAQTTRFSLRNSLSGSDLERNDTWW